MSERKKSSRPTHSVPLPPLPCGEGRAGERERRNCWRARVCEEAERGSLSAGVDWQEEKQGFKIERRDGVRYGSELRGKQPVQCESVRKERGRQLSQRLAV